MTDLRGCPAVINVKPGQLWRFANDRCSSMDLVASVNERVVIFHQAISMNGAQAEFVNHSVRMHKNIMDMWISEGKWILVEDVS